MPGSIYLRAISLSDTLVLGFSAEPFALGFLFEINLYDVSLGVCKMFMTMEHMFKLTSIWFIVILTVIRTVMLCRPLKSIRLMSKQATIWTIGMVIVVSVAINIPFGTSANLVSNMNNSETPVDVYNRTSTGNQYDKGAGGEEILRNDGQGSCKLDPESFLFKHEKILHNWGLDFVLIFSLPLLIITISNLTVLIVIRHQHKKLMGKDSHRFSHKEGSLNKSMTTWVITISTFHVISEGFWAISSQVEGFLEIFTKTK